MKNNPLLMTDGYKTSHHRMYPEGTTEVYSNFTPRSVKYMPLQAKKVVVFGVQYTIKKIGRDVPVLLERDFNIPEMHALQHEVSELKRINNKALKREPAYVS